MALLKSGYVQVLPCRDKAGRKIVAIVGNGDDVCLDSKVNVTTPAFCCLRSGVEYLVLFG